MRKSFENYELTVKMPKSELRRVIDLESVRVDIEKMQNDILEIQRALRRSGIML